MSATPETLLHDDLLERIRERAAGYDRDNAFFTEDLAELREAGYLHGARARRVRRPRLGLRRRGARADAARRRRPRHRTRREHAPRVDGGREDPARPRRRHASTSSSARPAAGEVFGFGISEAGNDLMLFGSRTTAEPQADGGYRYSGRKIFTSLSPAWTRLGTMGLDTASADAPKIVYGFIDREDPDVRILDDWDTIGMRASQSRTTVLDGAFAAPDRIVRRLDPGPNADPLIFGIFASFELLLAARLRRHRRACARPRRRRRAPAHLDEARRRAARRRTPTSAGASPMPRSRRTRSSRSSLAVARDLDELVDHGSRWFAKLVGVKVRATETAKQVVDQAVRVVGRIDVLRRIRARAPLPRRARGHLPSLRRRVGALHRRERLARAARRPEPARRSAPHARRARALDWRGAAPPPRHHWEVVVNVVAFLIAMGFFVFGMWLMGIAPELAELPGGHVLRRHPVRVARGRDPGQPPRPQRRRLTR